MEEGGGMSGENIHDKGSRRGVCEREEIEIRERNVVNGTFAVIFCNIFCRKTMCDL